MQTAGAAYPTTNLARFGRELEAVRRDAAALTDELSDGQLAWRPGPGRWSVGEIVSHLHVLNTRYLEAIDLAMEQARARGRTGPDGYRPGLVGGFMTRMMEPPVKRRLKAPAIFRPVDRDWRAELAAYRATHDALEERLRQAGGVSLAKARVVSPATRLVRINLGDSFALLLAHERRHLWQLRELRSDPAFPGA
jgi:hypothetical protein